MSHAATSGLPTDSQQGESSGPGAHTPSQVAVLGAGAWGTVVASLLARNGHSVRLWSHRPELAELIQAERRNPQYAPTLLLPTNLSATASLATATESVDLAFVVVPTAAVRGLAAQLAREGYEGALVSCSKGLEVGSLNRMSQVVAEELPQAPFAVLSGPNLAGEIAAGLPAAATVASATPDLALRVQRLLQQPTFRLYTSADVAGVEAGGALKNVIALASGISDGLGIGENARASLITRGLAELVRLGVALGGEVRTFYGLAGLGDLVATCSSDRSRNHQAGVRLARGETLEDLTALGITAEGIPTVKAINESDIGRTIELPISREVYKVLFERKDPRQGIVDLMTRAERAE